MAQNRNQTEKKTKNQKKTKKKNQYPQALEDVALAIGHKTPQKPNRVSISKKKKERERPLGPKRGLLSHFVLNCKGYILESLIRDAVLGARGKAADGP